MKKILALVLVLVMMASLSITAYADDIKVAFSQIGQESDWRTANTDSIKGTIEGHDGWTLIYDDAQQKQENQIKALRNFITQAVDYILFTGVVETGWDEPGPDAAAADAVISADNSRHTKRLPLIINPPSFHMPARS